MTNLSESSGVQFFLSLKCCQIYSSSVTLQIEGTTNQTIKSRQMKSDFGFDARVKVQYPHIYCIEGRIEPQPHGWNHCAIKLRSLNLLFIALQEEMSGNNDGRSVVRHTFIPPVYATYIRIHPMAYNNKICLRMELYGCPNCKLLNMQLFLNSLF